MPKADDTSKVACLQSVFDTGTNATRRRVLAGIGGAALVLPATNALAAAEHPDAELLMACARFEALEAAYRTSCDTDMNTDLHCPDGYQEAMEAVENTPARTFAGMQAKARVIVAFHKPEYLGHEDLMWSLVQDVAGLSGRFSGLDGEV